MTPEQVEYTISCCRQRSDGKYIRVILKGGMDEVAGYVWEPQHMVVGTEAGDCKSLHDLQLLRVDSDDVVDRHTTCVLIDYKSIAYISAANILTYPDQDE